MASGKLGNLVVPAGSFGTLFQATASRVTTFNMNICNTTGNTITFRVAISVASTPTSGEYLEYDTSLPPNGVWERTALVASGGEYILIQASDVGLNARAWGFEQ